jgi:hypothetical protein
MFKLIELGFIKAKADGIREFGQVLLPQPTGRLRPMAEDD